MFVNINAFRVKLCVLIEPLKFDIVAFLFVREVMVNSGYKCFENLSLIRNNFLKSLKQL